jgi:hypothetical protein
VESIFIVPPYLAAVAGAAVVVFGAVVVVTGAAVVVFSAAVVVAGEVVVDDEQALKKNIEINEIASSIKSHFFIVYTSYKITLKIICTDRKINFLSLYILIH